ncbi:hypothetical protein WEH80_28950 [Actinomycetes bacterium KLBMP 9759]
MRALLAVVAIVIGAVAGPAPPGTGDTGTAAGVDPTKVPALAREMLPLIVELTSGQCPELPPVWVVAQAQTESGWDPALHGDAAGRPAGLFQFGQRSWQAAGGAPWASDPPAAGSDVLTAAAHLRVAVPWICANLRAAAAHLTATGKPADPLDAMLVCHIAGCGRVTRSATGVPVAGEAECSARCAAVIARYVGAVRANVERFAAASTAPTSSASTLAAPAAWTGGTTDCRPPDPTGDGCLTGATRHGLEAAEAAFGSWTGGPVIRSAGCWDEHAWNPRSDHSRGRACDLFATAPGTFAKGAELEAGWRVAGWFRDHAEPLRVGYLIWQGRYWDPGVADDGGWGRRYTGGGIYDTSNATGGHFDHVHVSFRE